MTLFVRRAALVVLLGCACLEPVGEQPRELPADAGLSSTGGSGGGAPGGGSGATGGGATGGGPMDAGSTDASTDAGSPDAGSADAGSADAGAAGARDGGVDAGRSGAGCDAGDRALTCQDTDSGRCAQLEQVGCGAFTVALAVEGDALLSSDLQYGVVLRSLSGASPPRTLSLQQSPAIALRDGFATWFDGGFTLSRLALDGGLPFTLAATSDTTYAIAVNRTHVYWVPSKYPRDTILRASQGTGAVEVVVSGEQEVTSIAVDDSAVYWSSIVNGSIRSRPLDGGVTSVLFTGQWSPVGLKLVGGLLYWAEDNVPGAVRRGPVTGGVPQLIIDNLNDPRTFVTDGTTLYVWSQPYLLKVPAGGGPPQTLLTALIRGQLALSPTTLYLANFGIWALPR